MNVKQNKYRKTKPNKSKKNNNIKPYQTEERKLNKR